MNEDFVSFDLAKKLKEKGFREKCLAFYTSTKSFYYNNTNVCSDVEDLLECCNESEEYDDIDAPTIAQVLKWMRENKELFVEVSVNNHTGFDFYFTIYEKGEEGWVVCGFDEEWYDTYERAALAGIECVIDNLI